MKTSKKPDDFRQKESKQTLCLSCGTVMKGKKRKYCSVDCRKRLRRKLTMQTGLLKALHAKYATFYFTELLIIMDLLPYGEKNLFSFIYPRLKGNKPADDFSRMATTLGNLWWAEKKRTNKKYLASRQVLTAAERTEDRTDSIKPVELKIPSIKGSSLLYLKLGKTDLESCEYQTVIKKKYWKEAKKHHPDMGGNPDVFRKIHKAYEDLLNWADNPTFIKRLGFPDKWFYNGKQNRWVQPIQDYPTDQPE